MLRHDEEWENMDPKLYKSSIVSLSCLTFTRLDILFRVGLISYYIETPMVTHMKICITSKVYLIMHGLYNLPSSNLKLIEYSDSD